MTLGIARATAIAFARDGCSNLLLGDLNDAGLEETKKLISGDYPSVNIHIGKLDVSDEKSVTDFFAQGVQKFGRIDFAANVAGYAHKVAPTHELAESEYEKSYRVNQKGVMRTHHYFRTRRLTIGPGILLRARGAQTDAEARPSASHWIPWKHRQHH